MSGDNPGMAVGTTGDDRCARSHLKQSFLLDRFATGDASRVAPRAIPSADGAESVSLRAIPALLPVIPSAYGDDDRYQALLTASIGDAA